MLESNGKVMRFKGVIINFGINKFPCDYKKFKENIVKNRNSNFRVCRIDVPFVSRCKSRGYSKVSLRRIKSWFTYLLEHLYSLII